MAPKLDFKRWITKIPEHVGLLSDAAATPIGHYQRGANDAYNLHLYFNRLTSASTGTWWRHE